MNEKPIVCVGDATSHGGAVISGSPSATIEGNSIARLGDKVTCPRCRPHAFQISSASANHKVDGLPVARDGDAVSCGAILMAARDADTT